MGTRVILAILIFLFVVGLTFFIRINANSSFVVDGSNLTSQEQANLSINVSTQPPVTPSGVSAAALAAHNVRDDCWVSYKGKVYDITSFLPNHPGSAGAIIPYCGTSSEFENAFTRKHGTSKVDTLMRVGVIIGDFDVVGRSA